MAAEIKNTALECLQILLSQVRREVNFNALLTPELVENLKNPDSESNELIRLGESQKLDPVKYDSVEELLKDVHGPALAKLANGNWILINNTRNLKEESTVIIDPAAGRRQLRVQNSELIEKISGPIILFRNLKEIDTAKQTALYCLCSIAQHNGVKMDLRRVMHDYAIDDKEPRTSLFHQIAADYEFKTRECRLDWDQLTKLGDAYPVIGIKENDRKFLICGFRKSSGENAENKVAVIDPEVRKNNASHMEFLSREEFEKALASYARRDRRFGNHA
jgi:ABC-type bacteriocin/lantibiotic exporter with double-glycine peptidase domain